MNHSQSNYPVGARWECEDDYGRIGYIQLNKRTDYLEQWYFGWYYSSDRSGHQFEWTYSYQAAKRNHWIIGRFKRVN